MFTNAAPYTRGLIKGRVREIERLHILLIKHGGYPGVPASRADHDGKDPLASYVTNLFFNANTEIMASLLAYGAKVQYEDSVGRNLAHHPARIHDEVNVMQWSMLRTWGIEVDAFDHVERDVLHHASVSGSVSVVLLGHVTRCPRLDHRQRDVHDKTALDYAWSESRRSHHPQLFRRVEECTANKTGMARKADWGENVCRLW